MKNTAKFVNTHSGAWPEIGRLQSFLNKKCFEKIVERFSFAYQGSFRNYNSSGVYCRRWRRWIRIVELFTSYPRLIIEETFSVRRREFPETRNLRRRNVASLTRGPEPSGVWRLLAQKISGWSGIDCGEIGQGSAITYTFIHQRRDGDGEQITSVHRIAGNGSREPLMIYGRRIRILNSVINSSCLWKPLCVPSPPLCPSISLSLSLCSRHLTVRNVKFWNKNLGVSWQP